jgi:hypothetical protein
MEETAQNCEKLFYKQILDFQCPSKILNHTSKLLNFVKITGPYSGSFSVADKVRILCQQYFMKSSFLFAFGIYGPVERLDQGHLHPHQTYMSRPGIEPGPPGWEASFLAKSYSNSILMILLILNDDSEHLYEPAIVLLKGLAI